jgi:hypothetical protein
MTLLLEVCLNHLEKNGMRERLICVAVCTSFQGSSEQGILNLITMPYSEKAGCT